MFPQMLQILGGKWLKAQDTRNCTGILTRVLKLNKKTLCCCSICLVIYQVLSALLKKRDEIYTHLSGFCEISVSVMLLVKSKQKQKIITAKQTDILLFCDDSVGGREERMNNYLEIIITEICPYECFVVVGCLIVYLIKHTAVTLNRNENLQHDELLSVAKCLSVGCYCCLLSHLLHVFKSKLHRVHTV